MSQYPTPENSLKAVRKLLARPCLGDIGRIALLKRYADLHRQMRVLRISQWEVAHALADDWHGTPEELIDTAKGLIK